MLVERSPVNEVIEFQVNGITVRLTRSEVERAVVGAAPEPVQRHGVEIAGVRFPVKQAFALATGLDRLDFTSAVARRNLVKLGFRVFREAA